MTDTGMPVPEVNWGDIGYITYKRTYARKKKDGSTEEFHETVNRELKGIHKQLKLELTDKEVGLYKYMRFNMKGSVAGRFMWQLGTQTVNKLGLSSLMNCAFVVIDEPIRPFTWAMDNLMLGSGVGYSIKREHVYKLPKLQRRKIKIERWDDKQADFIVPDTREGWVKLLGKVLKAYFYSGKGFTYSMQLIRGRGELIKGFGGVASGPGVYEEGLNEICNILDNRRGKQLKPIDCLDIMNIIGQIVVAGNVRRSAQLAMGDYDDLEFLKAKRWDLGSIPNWRAMSNNSVDVYDVKDLPDEFWQTYQQGEPYGLINMELSREVGRLGETQYPDNSEGYNPSLRGGTKVWTLDGIKPIEDLEDTDFFVRNLNGKVVPANCWMSDPNATLYEIELQGGHKYYCTAEHKWPVITTGGLVKRTTLELQENDVLPITQFNKIGDGTLGNYSDGFFIGWLYGDGGIHKRKDSGRLQLNLIVSKKDDAPNVSEILLDKLNSLKKIPSNWGERKGNKELSCSAKSVFDYLESFGVDNNCERLPSVMWDEASEEFRRGFIDGIFSSDGSIEPTGRIRISSCKDVLIRELSEFLGFYGIKSTTFHCKSPLNGKLFDRYTLSIGTGKNILHFKNIFKLTTAHKCDRLNEIVELNSLSYYGDGFKVVSVTKTNIKEPVWDIHVKDDTHTFQISHVITGNCAEQSLANHEVCCLAEVFLPNIQTKEELISISRLLYKVNKHSLSIKSHNEETEKIVHKNMRMGIGITGVMMCSEEQLSWLDECYRELREFDKEYSAQMGWPESIKLTTCKPSGTASLLAGVTPGVHPATAGQYYIRRIRMSADSDLVDVCKAHGYFVEYAKQFDGTDDKTTVVVEFPCKYSADVLSAEDVDVIDQLETVKFMQTNWSDNSVSVTAYYKKEDIERIKEYLKENFKDNFKSLSFLLYSGHGFVQAPYEPITKEQYEYLNSKVISITSVEIEEDEISEELGACGIGGCPIK